MPVEPPASLTRVGSFLSELKRRKVYQVTAICLVLAVGGLELASVLLPATRLPDWFDELFLGIAIVGLPLILVLAWTFDLTEKGIERTPDVIPASATTEPRGEDSAARLGAVTPARDLDPLAVAVLPFENLSGSEAAEPFALGLHDDLLTELSRASARRILTHHPLFEYGLWVEGVSLNEQRRSDAGMVPLGRLRDRWTRGWPEVGEALVATERGDAEAVRSILQALADRDIPFKAGLVHAMVGQVDEAFAALRRGWPLPWDESLYLYCATARPLDSLRADPRLTDLVEDVVESWRAVDA